MYPGSPGRTVVTGSFDFTGGVSNGLDLTPATVAVGLGESEEGTAVDGACSRIA